MKKAFALIYVLMITTIVLISTTSILSLGLSDIRQKNKVLATAGAYQMAQSGLEDGIANYRINKANDCDSRYYNVSTNLYEALNPLDEQGAYEFTICSTQISAIGYFKGSKIKMQADKGADDTKWDIHQVGF